MLVLAVSSLPYLAGYAAQGASWRFTGFVFGVEDGNSYIAKMLAGAAGAWVFRSPYSAMPQGGVVMYLPYLILGKLAAPPGMHEELIALFHLFRIGAGLLAVRATYDFLAYFISDAGRRRWGLALAVLGGGLGWLLALLGRSAWPDLPLDFYSPETFGFLGIYGLPHLALARAFLLWALLAYLKAAASLGETRGLPWRAMLKTGVLWLLAGLAQPLDAGVIGLVIGLHWLARTVFNIKSRTGTSFNLRLVLLAAGAAVLPGLFLVYNLWALAGDPYLKSWEAQNLVRSPGPLQYLLAYGLLLPFAWLGGRRLVARLPLAGWLPAAWCLALPLLVYAPLNLNRRLADGAWVALVLLAVEGGMGEGWKAGRLRLFNPRAFIYLTLLAFPSTLMLLAGGLLAAFHLAPPAFRPADEAAVFQYLAANDVPETVVLSSFDTGNALPAWAPLRVAVGHGAESAGLALLLPRIARFYSSGTPDAERQALLRELGARYVFWGPAERLLGDWDPGRAGYLARRFQQGDYTLFEALP